MRLFFATDIHGSERCFLKFLNAAQFYGAQVLIMGGDLTGKAVVPVVETANGRLRATVHGVERIARTEREQAELERDIRFAGFYPYRTTEAELAAVGANEEQVQTLVRDLVLDSVSHWIDMAESRLKGTGVQCFIQPGNDDDPAVGDVLSRSSAIVNPEGRIVELPDGHFLVSSGFANETPWNCPRDLPEAELQKRLDDMLDDVPNAERAIFNLHCPPYESGIDEAPKLDADLRPVLHAGGQTWPVPVGSTSVRRAIEEHQPVVSLHGHIHECRGAVNLGRTVCINPGSRYNEGILQGAVVDLAAGRVQNYQLISG